MKTRLGMGLATISTLAIVCLLCQGDRVSAIALDNDVDISGSEGPLHPECLSCVVIVHGAPRLAQGREALDFLVHIDIDKDEEESIQAFTLNLNLLRAGTLQPTGVRLVGPSCPVEDSCMTSYDLSVREDFENTQILESIPHAQSTFVFVVEGSLQLSGSGPATVTVTVTGPGHEIIADTVGDKDDFQSGGALDIPARSVELVQALGRIGVIRGRDRVVELDVDRPRGQLAVGFTHAFGLARRDRIQAAILTLTVAGNGPLDDFLLVDNGVRDVGSRERCVPLIPLDTSQLRIEVDLTHVTSVSSSYPSLRDHPCFAATDPTDLRSELRDGRFDVIVVGDLKVDFAELRITLRNPPDR